MAVNSNHASIGGTSVPLDVPGGLYVNGTQVINASGAYVGDVAATAGSIGTDELANDAVTYAKMQNVSATSRLLGRSTAGAGDVEEITVAGDIAQAGSNFTIQNNKITTAMLQDDSVTTGKLDETTIQYATADITNTAMLALRATPQTLVAAPGAGKYIEFVSATLFFDYSAAYTETDDNLVIRYNDGSGATVSETIETTGFLDATADTVMPARAGTSVAAAKTACENKALVIHNSGNGEFGGGNPGNVVRVRVAYRVLPTGF